MLRHPTRLLAVIGPGILVAATGVGAGDLATGALAGGKLGVAVLWAVLIGAGGTEISASDSTWPLSRCRARTAATIGRIEKFV